MDKQKIIEAGKIAKEVHEWIKPQIKKGTPLIEIAEKIESKIIELGGKPAFPTNLSINEVAAHYTPSHDDETKAHGLLKIDFGAHVNGWISDTAFSVDLENSDENKKLIKSSEDALNSAINLIKSLGNKKVDNKKLSIVEPSIKKSSLDLTTSRRKILTKSDLEQSNLRHELSGNVLASGGKAEKILTSEIGKTIQQKISSQGFQPIINLSGHEIEEYNLHAGLTIPNFDNKSNEEIKKGLYAIEPFATLKTGTGKVKDGKPSGIYQLIDERNIRSPLAREILEFIIKEYNALPFCSRWIAKKFSTRGLFALRQLEQNKNLHQYAQLVESSGAKVSQAENTILVGEEGVVVTTG